MAPGPVSFATPSRICEVRPVGHDGEQGGGAGTQARQACLAARQIRYSGARLSAQAFNYGGGFRRMRSTRCKR